jgi:ATP-dependent DNA ligase
MKHPILYHQGKHGEVRQWEVWTKEDVIYTKYGVVGGVLQTSHKRATGKNIGRSNQTSPEQQAMLEATSMWNKKIESKYTDDINKVDAVQTDRLRPMLAKAYDDTKKNQIKYPAYSQPKLDGLRCIARKENGKVLLTSRNNKPYNLPHIEEELAWLPEEVPVANDLILDGEIYVHGMTFQEITRLAKKWRPDESTALEYHVYDIPSEETWEVRSANLLLSLKESDHVKLVQCSSITDDKSLWTEHYKAIAAGYEGIIVRNPDGLYRWGYRSSDLIKVKLFDDDEFEVLEIKQGIGKMEGRAVFVCKNNTTEDTFECTIKASLDERARIYRNRKDFIGSKLTVKFFGRTDANIPRFPVGKGFRDKKDFPCQQQK